jgi:hypothetical protein
MQERRPKGIGEYISEEHIDSIFKVEKNSRFEVHAYFL